MMRTVRGTTGRMYATLKVVMAALLAFAAFASGACGNDTACPNGTEGSPCQLVTEPTERPEIPSAPDQDTLAPDAESFDVDDGGDGNDSEDTDAVDDGAGATEDADVSAARHRVRRFASNEAAGGNEARGRETSDTHAGTAVVTLAGRPTPWSGLPIERRGGVGTRTTDRETRDGDDETLNADAKTAGPRGTPWHAHPAPRRQRTV